VLGDLIKVYRKMPWGNGETLLTSDSHWRLGSHNTITPTFVRPAVMIGVSPLLIMDLDVHYGPDLYFTYNRFPSGRSNYDPQNVGEPDEYMHWFHNAQANLTLKAAIGPVALLHMADLDWYKNNEWFFNWDVATLVKEGFFLRNRTFLAAEFQPNWRFFVNYENSKSFETDFLSEVASSGFIVMDPDWNSLTVIIQLGYYIHNPDFKGLKPWAAMTMEWDFPDD
jgi:hypothetical protein